MRGRWKLYLPHTYRTLAGREGLDDGRPIAYEQRKIESPELYDLEADFGETTNVAEQHADVVRDLLDLAEKARSDLGDRLTNRPNAGRAVNAL